MKPVIPIIAVCVATVAVVYSGFAYSEAPIQKIQDRFPVSVVRAEGGSILTYAEAASVPAPFFPPPPGARPVPEAAGNGHRAPNRMAADFPPPPPFERPPFPRPHDRPDAPHAFNPHDPLALAALLSTQETALGIRADQLDAWRAYTDALLDLATPPDPPARTSVEPFATTEAIAQHAAEAGRKAQALLNARSALIARLTPAQLQRAVKLEPPMPEHPHAQGERP